MSRCVCRSRALISLLLPMERKAQAAVALCSTLTRLAAKYPPPAPTPPRLTRVASSGSPFGASLNSVLDVGTFGGWSSLVIRYGRVAAGVESGTGSERSPAAEIVEDAAIRMTNARDRNERTFSART